MPGIFCPFCDRMHTGEFLDEIDEQIMACRDKASVERRGDVAAFDWSAFERIGARVDYGDPALIGEPDAL